MPPASAPHVDPGFEKRLIEHARPIAEHFLASALHHFFNSGIYDRLCDAGGTQDIPTLASSMELDETRTLGFLLFLANEDIVVVKGMTVELTRRAHDFAEFRAWYTLMIGGYSTTLDQLGDAMRNGAPGCSRNGRNVGLGSCEISKFDGMPMTRSLLAADGTEPQVVLDLGCGNGLYLIDFCKHMPGIEAWGVEPDPGSFREARDLVQTAGIAERVHLINTSAEDFLANPPEGCRPDLIVFGYVLQEILGQSGETEVVRTLESITARFPNIVIVVIEVANEITNAAVMRHGLARNFWNTYYLIHYFTNQRLETADFWTALFDRAGLDLRHTVTTPEFVDSTGLELGYLLRKRRAQTLAAVPSL